MDNLVFTKILNNLTDKSKWTLEEQRRNDKAVNKLKEYGITPTAQCSIEIRDLIQGKSGYDYSYKDLTFDSNTALTKLLDNCLIVENCKADAIIPYLDYRNAQWGINCSEALTQPNDVRFKALRVSNNISISKSYIRQQTKATEDYIKNALIQSLLEKTFATLFDDEEGHNINGVLPLFNPSNTVEINTVDDILNLQKDVDLVSNDNVFICSPSARTKLYKLGVIDKGLILDSPTIFTNLIKDGYICYISLKNLALCIYDVIGITVDPYSKAKENKIVITVDAFLDAQLLFYKLIKVGKFVEPSDEPTGNDEPTEPTNGDNTEPTTEEPNDGE